MTSKPSTSFYLALLEFLLRGKQQLMAIGDEFGLTSIQAITLLLIDDNHPRAMGTLCSLYHCDASNMTGIIDGLEAKGLVARRNDPLDRRKKIVCLEPTGKAMQQQIIDRMGADNAFMLGSLSQTEADQFVGLIEKLARHYDN